MKRLLLTKCNNCGHLNPTENSRCSNPRCQKKWGFSFGDALGTSLINDSDTTTVWGCPSCKNHVNHIDNKACGGCGWKEPSSICFLTTIVVNELGMSDDCRELNLMRTLRNDYLLHFKQGIEIMAYYYSLSEEICAKIEDMQNKHEYCHSLMNDYIQPVCNLVENNKFDKATSKYLELVEVVKALNHK
jgi:hypothetical protein